MWSLGNGESIEFWHDDWLSIGPIRGWIQGPLSMEESYRKVGSVINNGIWDIENLTIDLPDHILHRILSIPPPNRNDVSDLMSSSFVTSSGFSLGLAYKAQLPSHHDTSDLSWIWEGFMEPKIKFFIWLLWHDRIPHRHLLTIRRITQDSSCPRCQELGEDSHHIIKTCQKSAEIWNLPNTPQIHEDEFRSWLKENMSSNKSFRGIPWKSVFPYTCYEIWKDRNQCVFKNLHPSPIQVISFKASGGARDYILSIKDTSMLGITRRPMMYHPREFLCIYVDASFISPLVVAGLGGWSWITRKNGSWVGGKKFTLMILLQLSY